MCFYRGRLRRLTEGQRANLTFTYGGVKTDLQGHVVSTNDVPIPGLWGAGEMTGLYYNEYPPATSVLRSLTWGRLIGTQIAQAQGQQEQQQVNGKMAEPPTLR